MWILGLKGLVLGAVYMERGRSQNQEEAEQLFVGFTCRNFGLCGYQVEK